MLPSLTVSKRITKHEIRVHGVLHFTLAQPEKNYNRNIAASNNERVKEPNRPALPWKLDVIMSKECKHSQ